MNELDASSRLKNLISIDRAENPYKIEKLLKSEIVNVLRNYFEINIEDVNLSIIITKEGNYDIQFNILSKHFLKTNIFA